MSVTPEPCPCPEFPEACGENGQRSHGYVKVTGSFREHQGARVAAYAPICSSDMAKSTAFPLIFILPFPAEWQ